jgi:hypothetical protein
MILMGGITRGEKNKNGGGNRMRTGGLIKIIFTIGSLYKYYFSLIIDIIYCCNLLELNS